MLTGSWLMAQGSLAEGAVGGVGGGGAAAPGPGGAPLSHEPWAINHQHFITDKLMKYSIMCYEY